MYEYVCMCVCVTHSCQSANDVRLNTGHVTRAAAVILRALFPRLVGSRPSVHYFRSVCLSVCLFVQSFYQPSLIRCPSNLDICYMSGSSCVPWNIGAVRPLGLGDP